MEQEKQKTLSLVNVFLQLIMPLVPPPKPTELYKSCWRHSPSMQTLFGGGGVEDQPSCDAAIPFPVSTHASPVQLRTYKLQLC